ncbi:MAG: alpha/beta fold hydrolase [Actinomycetota bacterium]
MSLSLSEATDLFRSPPDRHLDVGAGEVALRTIGSGPDVLFVHGWPVSGATWRKLLPHLVDHVTCHVIDLPSSGSSRFDATTPMSVEQHITSVRRIVDQLDVADISLVGHDSGGMISRHALAGDPRLRSMGLINTEPSTPGWRFRSFLAARRLPGLAAGLGWVCGQPWLRRTKFVFGDAFVDRSLLDGDFAEFALDPLHQDAEKRTAAAKILKSFEMDHLAALPSLHARIDVPVALVWGDQDPFFTIGQARLMVDEFPNASLVELPGVGLFSHEEAPAEVAAALLPTLTAR